MDANSYLEMMKSNEPYISRFMEVPRNLKDNANRIFKELEFVGDEDRLLAAE